MDDPYGDLEAELVDLSDLRLTDLRALGDTPLAHSLRRIIEESQDETAVVVLGFESSIEVEGFRRVSDGGEDVYPLTAFHRSSVPIREFVLKIATSCNLACDYCYIYTMADQTWRFRPKLIMTKMIDAAMSRIGEHVSRHSLQQVALILHGGEPLLAGRRALEYVAGAVRRELPPGVLIDLRIQTNGVLLDEELFRTLRSHHIRVGVSIDGGPVHHNRHRNRPDGRGSYAATARGLDYSGKAENRDLYAGLLCVVDTRNDPVDVYEALLEFSPPALDFLLPHGNWSAPPPGRGRDIGETPMPNG